MKLLKATVAGASVCGLLLTATPVHARDNSALQAAVDRCEELAGREASRCKYINSRIERHRLYRAKIGERIQKTLREKRHVSKNVPTRNVRRIGNHNLTRLRQHDHEGGRPRRMLKRRHESARNSCKYKEGTEKHLCVRAHWKALRRGNTR